jgi:hypothetical protein
VRQHNELRLKATSTQLLNQSVWSGHESLKHALSLIFDSTVSAVTSRADHRPACAIGDRHDILFVCGLLLYACMHRNVDIG